MGNKPFLPAVIFVVVVTVIIFVTPDAVLHIIYALALIFKSRVAKQLPTIIFTAVLVYNKVVYCSANSDCVYSGGSSVGIIVISITHSLGKINPADCFIRI